jgi:hypothetical protein
MKKSEKNTLKFNINQRKSNDLNWSVLEKQYLPTEDDINNNYNPFLLRQIQNYQPIYPLFFDMNENNYNSIALNHRYHIVDLETVLDTTELSICTKPIFIKYSPLLDPIRYMIGKYNINDPTIHTLPGLSSNSEKCDKKISYYNNAAYVDCFFSFLSSQLLHTHNFKHGIDFYGNFSAIQEKFKMNILDDFEYLNSSSFFLNNAKKLFKITNHEIVSYFNQNNNSRPNKMKINIIQTKNNHNLSNISIIDIHNDNDDSKGISESNKTIESISNEIIEPIYLRDKNVEERNSSVSESSDADESDTDDSDTDDDSDRENSSDDVENENSEDNIESEKDDEDDNEDEETPIYAYIDNFPVQMICLEKCDGTLDQLFERNEVNAENSASILFQILMILITYQKAFHMTHNDLHTNNIMYVHTTEEFLYYKFNKKNYKIPTYGKIFKIIDFGRSIYKYNTHLLCSDSFATGGDAATQYNFGPFYNEDKPTLEPNYSFDLCRLGCSIYDFIIDDDIDKNDMDEFQKTIYRWCQDDAGKNVLYKKNGEERYPNFKLYKMIARNVHMHTPQSQLNYPFFSKFEISPKKSQNIEFMNLDKIPSYV